MSEEEKNEKFKVYDKRKFDTEGNPRKPDAEEEVAAEPEQINTEQSAASDEPEVADTGDVSSESDGHREPSGPPPEIDFNTFIISLGSQAMMSLGMLAPQGEKPEVNIEAAQQLIDIMAMLREKTRGNLEASEITTIDNLLYDLRMSYVQIKKSQEG